MRVNFFIPLLAVSCLCLLSSISFAADEIETLERELEQELNLGPKTEPEADLLSEENPAISESPVPPEAEEKMIPEASPAPVVIEEPIQETPTAETPVVPESNEVAEIQNAVDETLVVDSPDEKFEARIHDLYLNFFNRKISDSEWSAIAGERLSEAYEIQSGDTLWDISKTFFGDGFYWPKIWSVNEGISNPHLIARGHSIQFFLGNLSEPPAFTVVENSQVQQTQTEKIVETKVKIQDGASTLDFQIPPPENPAKPVLRKLPPTFPEWSVSDESQDREIRFDQRALSKIVENLPLRHFVTENPPPPQGKVVDLDFDRQGSMVGDVIYLEFQSKGPQAGDKFLIVRYGDLLRNPSDRRFKLKARMIDVLGEVVVVRKMDPRISRTQKKAVDIYQAKLTHAVDPIGRGALVVNGSIEMVNITADQDSQAIQSAQLIGFGENSDRVLGSPSNWVYLNQGSRAGFKVGQILPVMENREARAPDSLISSQDSPIGKIKIVNTDANFSTGFLLTADRQLELGDYVGKLPRNQ